jgi:hypothetical protein
MPNPTNPEALPGFDAVAESRKWKEAVARETEGMSIAERMAYFRRHSSVETIRQRASAAESVESCAVRGEQPEK